MKADYPLRFINSVVNEFEKGKEFGDENFIVATSLFEIAKLLLRFVEYHTVNWTKLNENILWRNFINSLTILSEW